MSLPSPTVVIEALAEVHSTLYAFVENLDPADHTRQSYCDDWSVAQVLSHLGSGAVIQQATIEAAFAGASVPEDFNPGVWAQWDAMSPQDMVHSYLEASSAYMHRLCTLNAAELETSIPLSYMPEPVGLEFLLMLRLNEQTHHAWDVMVSFDDAKRLEQPGVELLAQWINPFLGYSAKADSIQWRGSIPIALTEPTVNRTLTIDDTVSIAEAGNGEGLISAPAESWLRLAAGRLDAKHTPDDVTVESDGLTLDDLRAVFPGS